MAVTTLIVLSCKKGWLEEKPLQSLVTLNSVGSLQGLLDNTTLFNTGQPRLGEMGNDDYYLPDNIYNGLGLDNKNIYTWAPAADFYAGATFVSDWNNTYKVIYTCNTALEELEKLPSNAGNYADWANVKGSALFYRAMGFYNLSQVFCKPYVASTAGSDPGLVLRLSSDINLKTGRSTVKQSYDRILGDLKASIPLLPVLPPAFKTRPSKTACYGLLARIYLSMQDYDNAFLYADSCLKNVNTLMDYNLVTPGTTSAFTQYGTYTPETIYYAAMATPATATARTRVGNVDSVLYKSYAATDLRRSVFFADRNGRIYFRGSYATGGDYFNGIASNEMYLIRAECYARKSDRTEALKDLNTLLEKRTRNTLNYTPVTATDDLDALKKILTERRKELCYRGLRWSDLRRLNFDTRFQLTLKRVIAGQTYTLPPNDSRYVYPLPNDEIIYNGTEQNPR